MSDERFIADFTYGTTKSYKEAIIRLVRVSHALPHLDLNEMIYCLEMAMKHDKRRTKKKSLREHTRKLNFKSQ